QESRYEKLDDEKPAQQYSEDRYESLSDGEQEYAEESGEPQYVYKWIDEEGTEHYTNNINKVPEEYLDTVIKLEVW
ncbi:MAG: hypothetical protein GTN99_07985, partial [Candidatus Dadabacteria bacterium]|nr:hypothetical protein [Candidatus Dadabacteria bacterium]NIT14162.1 hypothetical protein [Candidatus Dadabacteria bacterium]